LLHLNIGKIWEVLSKRKVGGRAQMHLTSTSGGAWGGFGEKKGGTGFGDYL